MLKDAVNDNDAVNDVAVTGGSDRARASGAESADSAVTPARGGTRRRRRVVALSARDRARVERGESPEDLARADYEHDALSGPGEGLDTPAPGGAGSNDARLRRDIPPHWG